MAYTEADLAAVDALIAAGEKSVAHADRAVTYRPMSELLESRKLILADLRTRPRQTIITASKGFD